MASTPPHPVYIVSDCDSTPEITVGYESFSGPSRDKRNTIHLASSYKHIKSLLTHPRCLHPLNPRCVVVWPCESCESTFATAFWDAAKVLLDYFADFFANDTAVMHAVWFHLLDVWQESAHWFQYRDVQKMVDECDLLEQKWRFESGAIGSTTRAACKKADAFEKVFMDTVELIQIVIWGRRRQPGAHDTQGYAIYDPLGERISLQRVYHTGPWISGIKPWAQFLNNGGPGVVPPMPRPPLETGQDKLAEGEEIIAKRYIPHSAIGLLKKHIERDRDLADAHYYNNDRDNLANHLYIFDQYCPVFPQPNARTHSFVSSLLTSEDASARRTITYTLGNGTPPIVRHPADRYADEGMQVLQPDMNLVDEAVAACLGVEPYEPHGTVDDGLEDDLDDGDDNRVLDMWTVIETRGGKEEKEKGGNDEGDVFVLGEMFNNFCTVGDVENCLKV